MCFIGVLGFAPDIPDPRPVDARLSLTDYLAIFIHAHLRKRHKIPEHQDIPTARQARAELLREAPARTGERVVIRGSMMR